MAEQTVAEQISERSALVRAYCDYARAGDRSYEWAPAELLRKIESEPHEAWMIVRELFSLARDADSLAYIANGPLRLLLMRHGDVYWPQLKEWRHTDALIDRAVMSLVQLDGVPNAIDADIQRVQAAARAESVATHATEAAPPRARTEALLRIEGPYAHAWRSYSQGQTRRWGAVLAVPAVAGIAGLSHIPIGGAAVLVLASIVVAIAAQFGNSITCPRCGNPFDQIDRSMRLGYLIPMARVCSTCGLAKWSDGPVPAVDPVLEIPPASVTRTPQGWIVNRGESQTTIAIPGLSGRRIKADDDEVVASARLVRAIRVKSDDVAHVAVCAPTSRGRPPNYQVHAVLRSGERRLLIGGFQKVGEAEFIAHELRALWRMGSSAQPA